VKRKAVIFAIFLAILLPLLTLWATYLYEATYTGRGLFWLEPAYSEFRELLEDEKVEVMYHTVKYAGVWSIVDFKATVPFGKEFPYGDRTADDEWQIVPFLGILFVSLGGITIFRPGSEQ